MNRKPLFDRVLLEVEPEIKSSQKTSTGGIILPSTVDQPSQVRTATVLAVGTGEVLYNGEVRALQVKVGMKVSVLAHEVLSISSSVDPTEPMIGYIQERQILDILEE